MPTRARVYWDSAVFISRLQKTSGRIATLRDLTDDAEHGKLLIVTSVFTTVEVAWFQRQGLSDEKQEEAISDLFKQDYIAVRPLDRFICAIARDLMRQHRGLKPADATHIATALHNRVPVLHSYDPDFHKLDGKLQGLRLEEPKVLQLRFDIETENDEA